LCSIGVPPQDSNGGELSLEVIAGWSLSLSLAFPTFPPFSRCLLNAVAAAECVQSISVGRAAYTQLAFQPIQPAPESAYSFPPAFQHRVINRIVRQDPRTVFPATRALFPLRTFGLWSSVLRLIALLCIFVFA